MLPEARFAFARAAIANGDFIDALAAWSSIGADGEIRHLQEAVARFEQDLAMHAAVGSTGNR